HRFLNPVGRMHGHLYWNLLGQWEELKCGLRKAGADAHDRKKPLTLHGIGVDTWGVDFGLLGKGGEVLGNPFNYRDRRTAGMLDRLGLPTKILPEIIPSGTVLGPLSADVARECEVEPIPVIAPACHDTGSAVAAVPVESNGAEGDWCYISSGTWSLMGVEVP